MSGASARQTVHHGAQNHSTESRPASDAPSNSASIAVVRRTPTRTPRRHRHGVLGGFVGAGGRYRRRRVLAGRSEGPTGALSEAHCRHMRRAPVLRQRARRRRSVRRGRRRRVMRDGTRFVDTAIPPKSDRSAGRVTGRAGCVEHGTLRSPRRPMHFVDRFRLAPQRSCRLIALVATACGGSAGTDDTDGAACRRGAVHQTCPRTSLRRPPVPDGPVDVELIPPSQPDVTVSGLTMLGGIVPTGAPEPVDLDEIRSGGPPPDGIPSDRRADVPAPRRRRLPRRERAGAGPRHRRRRPAPTRCRS
jgi:hypothetical protein